MAVPVGKTIRNSTRWTRWRSGSATAPVALPGTGLPAATSRDGHRLPRADLGLGQAESDPRVDTRRRDGHEAAPLAEK